jgi:hypothetical protein
LNALTKVSVPLNESRGSPKGFNLRGGGSRSASPCKACFRRSPDRCHHEDEILLKTCTNGEMSLSLKSFQNSAQGEQLRNRWGQLPDLEGGTSIILISRETFRLLGTQTGLPHLEVDERMASGHPRGVVSPRNAGVSGRRVGYHKSCLAIAVTPPRPQTVAEGYSAQVAIQSSIESILLEGENHE